MADEHEFGLVMPFVNVVSVGGLYDDDAYVSGYEAGEISGVLACYRPNEHAVTVHAPNLAQLDLLAMHHGYRMDRESTEYEEWAYVRFVLDDFDA